MKLEIIIDTENGTIDLLKQGYNIIAETIYNEELTKNIVDLLQNELFEDISELTKMKW